MAAIRRRIVSEDLNRGFGATDIPTDSGGTRAATMVGIHSLLGNAYLSAADQSGDDASVQIAATIAALPMSGGTVDVRPLVGDQAWSTDPFTGLSAAKPVQILLGVGVTTIAVNVTVPRNVTLVFSQGSILSTSGVTLTVRGQIVAERFKIFAGTTVPAMSSPLSVVYPEWFGAVADGTTDDWAAIQGAVDSLISGGLLNTIQVAPGGTVLFGNGTYYHTQAISTCHFDGCPGDEARNIPVGTVNACVSLKGTHRGQSVLFTDQIIDMVQMFSWSCPSIVEDLYIASSGTTVGVRVRGNQTTLRRNWFLVDHSIIIESTAAIDTTGTVLDSNQCDAVAIGAPNGCITITRSGGSAEAPNNIQIVNQHCYGGSWCLLTDRIYDSRIDGMTNNGPLTYFMSIAGATRLAISNVTAVGGNVNNLTSEDGIEISDSDGVLINNFIASSFPGPALNVQNSTGVSVTNFAFSDNVQSASTTFPYEVFALNAELSLSKGRISNNTGHPTNAIRVEGSGPGGSYSIDAVVFTGSKFTSTVIDGVTGAGGMYRLSITNNDFRSTWTADPVIVAGAALHLNVSGNNFGQSVTTLVDSTYVFTNNCFSNNTFSAGNILLNGTAFSGELLGCLNGDVRNTEVNAADVVLRAEGLIQFKTGIVFANLGAFGNGTVTYCNDCTIANPCAGSGSGAIAKLLNGVWVCN